MDKKPHLIFPKPGKAERTKAPGRQFKGVSLPAKGQQIQRIGPKLNEIDKVLEGRRLSLQQSIEGVVPEMVLVLEIAGTITNFFSAVKKTPGLEFLAEFEEDFLPDDLFYHTDKEGRKAEKKYTGQIFLVMTNQKALNELKRYWDKYKKSEKFDRGTTKFRILFDQLKDIRPYSINDRLKDTGFEDYLKEQREHNIENVRFEVELFFRKGKIERQNALRELKNLLKQNGGKFLNQSETMIEEIVYHAFIAEAPIKVFDDLSENTNVTFLKCERIMFLRPVGQVAVKNPGEIEEQQVLPGEEIPLPGGNPVVALLDGLPLANHKYLANRLNIDDPDNYAGGYEAGERFHGTAMASLIIHGELDEPESIPLKRPIYVRPIMKPDVRDTFNKPRREAMPADKLPIDLIHRAVKRIFEGEGDSPPTSPKIKIINISIGDMFRPFQINISAWAKLLDWLAYKYNVLFVVSPGNYDNNIEFDIEESRFHALKEEEKEKLALDSIIKKNYDRKILTPAESINSLTVGATHSDSSTGSTFSRNVHPVREPSLLSTYSRIGFGYKGMVKPEVLMPGGRLSYRIDIFKTKNDKTVLSPVVASNIPPGQKAAVSGSPGDINKALYLYGTSNAAALATRLGAQIHDLLLEINKDVQDYQRISGSYFAVLIKTLIVHGAEWGNAGKIVEDILKNYPQLAKNVRKNHVAGYLGYGLVNRERVLFCTEQRVTLLGWGELQKEEAHIYSFPLPYSLSNKKFRKKLIVTLAWFSPLHILSSKYRKAQLFVDNYSPSDRMKRQNIPLNLKHLNSGYDISRKGTVQHDVMEGEHADSFLDGTEFRMKINCKEDAGGLSKKDKIKYGLAVTLEIDEKIAIPIYTEILQKIRPKIKIPT